MASVALEGVTKIYPGGVTGVRGLDLEVHDREFLVLLGPSGCGKTTTLRLIAGLEAATSGTIRIGASSVNHLAPKDRNVVMVFQNDALYPHMSVYRNMAYGLELRHGGGWFRRILRRLTSPKAASSPAGAKPEIRGRVHRTAELLGIESLLDRRPRQLSGGERQRVALGRAMVRRPAVFLFDEPLSNLDTPLRLEIRRELRVLQRRLQPTFIYVTHDQTEAMTLGDRIAVMHKGEIDQIGTPMDVYDQPRNRFVASFVGSPRMNFIRGRIQMEDNRCWFESEGGALRVPQPAVDGPAQGAERVELGVRPEDIQVTPCHRRSGITQGTVAVVDRLGDHAQLGVDLVRPGETTSEDQQRLTVRTDPRTSLQTGDCVQLTVNAQHTHVFDGDSGKNLMTP